MADDLLKINPHKHWMILVYTFLSLSLLLILFSFYLLYEIKNEQIFQVKIEHNSNDSLIKEDLLKKTINQFNNKATEEDTIQNGPFIYKDPSI